MLQTVIPQGYAPCLNLYDTQKAIGLLKRLFEDTLGGALHLRRVSAPLFVDGRTGLNDDLNGVERPVSFDIPDVGTDGQVVHSLAKWKRMALYRYQFSVGEGLYTDMNAIRRDEELDNLHSVYVDQLGLGEDHCPPGPERRLSPANRAHHCLCHGRDPAHPALGLSPTHRSSSAGDGGLLRHHPGAGGALGPTAPPRSGRMPG